MLIHQRTSAHWNQKINKPHPENEAKVLSFAEIWLLNLFLVKHIQITKS